MWCLHSSPPSPSRSPPARAGETRALGLKRGTGRVWHSVAANALFMDVICEWSLHGKPSRVRSLPRCSWARYVSELGRAKPAATRLPLSVMKRDTSDSLSALIIHVASLADVKIRLFRCLAARRIRHFLRVKRNHVTVMREKKRSVKAMWTCNISIIYHFTIFTLSFIIQGVKLLWCLSAVAISFYGNNLFAWYWICPEKLFSRLLLYIIFYITLSKVDLLTPPSPFTAPSLLPSPPPPHPVQITRCCFMPRSPCK